MWLNIRSGSQSGRTIEATGTRFLIGRGEHCELALDDEKASREHAVLEQLPDGSWQVNDLGSRNGTFVNGQQISGPYRLIGGEELVVGDTAIALTAAPPQAGPVATDQTAASTAAPAGAAAAGWTQPADAQTVQPDQAQAAYGYQYGYPAQQVPGSDAPVYPTAWGYQPSAQAHVHPPTGLTAERHTLKRSTRWAVVLAVASAVVAVVSIAIAGLVLASTRDLDGDSGVIADIPEVVDTVTPSTVLVSVVQEGEGVGAGTGWVLDQEQGFVVTNAHVVNAGSEFTVGAGNQERPAEVVGVAPCEDLALLQVQDTAGLKTLPLGSQSELDEGETVIAVGYPASGSLNDNLTTTTGVVSVAQTSFDLQAQDVPQYPNVIQTDAAINPGNSGGPLVNANSELVGVNSAGITLLGERIIQGQGYAIGVDRVKEIIPTLTSGESLAWTGMGFAYPTSEQQLTDAGFPPIPGLVVTHAVPGTEAEGAGFGAALALIVGVNGQEIDNTLPSYCEAVGEARSGDAATFSVIEQGSQQPRDVEVRFE
jgi:S1-C subfamily serine protease